MHPEAEVWERRYSATLREVEELRAAALAAVRQREDVEREHHTLAAAREIAGVRRWRQLSARLLPPTHPGDQHGEAAVLAELLPEADGRYVDVGASHPVQCSTTWQFYQRGWRGLLVEPLPQCWYDLLRQRPRDCLAPVAAGEAKGWAKLRVAGTVSSLRPEWDIAAEGETLVEVERLDALMDACPIDDGDLRFGCDLLSIDAEGSEADVLRGVDWGTFKPRVIIVEYRAYSPDGPGLDASAEFEPALLSLGYRVHWSDALNKIYAR